MAAALMSVLDATVAVSPSSLFPSQSAPPKGIHAAAAVLLRLIKDSKRHNNKPTKESRSLNARMAVLTRISIIVIEIFAFARIFVSLAALNGDLLVVVRGRRRKLTQ